MPTYTPPAGNAVDLLFVGGTHTPLAGNVVELVIRSDYESLDPTGFDASTVSTPEIVGPRTLTVSGIASTVVFGTGRVGNDTYFAPTGDAVILEFNDVAIQTDGAHVILRFGRLGVAATLDVYPSGIADYALGSTTIAWDALVAAPTGIDASAMGAATVFQSQIVAQGFVDSQFPDPVVENQFREINDAGSIYSTVALGTPIIFLGDFFVYPASLNAGSFPTPIIHHFVQYSTTYGSDFNARGTPTITHRVREIEVPFIATGTFGTALVGTEQYLYAEGWESSVVPETHTVQDDTQYYYLTGFTNTVFGTTSIGNYTQLVQAPVYPNYDRVAVPVIHNEDRYLIQGSYFDNNPPGEFGTAYVENINRELGAFGRHFERFGYQLIENAARPLFPAGLDETSFGEETFIAYENREVVPEGFDASFLPNYAIIYNDAEVLEPVGIASSEAIGLHDVLNANRTYTALDIPSTNVFGTAFIAYAIRTLGHYNPPFAPGFDGPDIRLDPYPVYPSGFYTYEGGGPFFVEEIFNRLFAQPVNVHDPHAWIGIATVENRNRTYSVVGLDQSEYGRPTIYNQNQELFQVGRDHFELGPVVIEYRTKTLAPPSCSRPSFSVTHTIRNVTPDPPHQQNILCTGFTQSAVGSVSIRVPYIYPVGIECPDPGVPEVRHPGISPRGYFKDTDFGIPTCSGTQFVTVAGVDLDLLTIERVPNPWFDPHTIYAPFGDQATTQARANHTTTGTFHVIDGLYTANVFGEGSHPWFGLNRVEHRIREVVTFQFFADSEYGTPTVELKNRRVYPDGIRSLRMGAVIFLNVPQFVTLDEEHQGIESTIEFGTPLVYDPVPADQIVTPSGFAEEFGTTNIELKNRAVYPEGIVHRGTPPDTNPWGVPYIGETPIRREIQGFIATQWGTLVIEYVNREFQFQGFEDSRMEPDPFNYGSRMRVRRINPPSSMQGFESLEIGTAAVEHGTRGISLTGEDESVFEIPWVHGLNTIAPSGLFSETFGDIDRWEENVLKVYGEDHSTIPRPSLARTVLAGDNDHASYGNASVGRVIYVAGMPEVGFDGPVLTDQDGCNNRNVVPNTMYDSIVPEPVVS